MALIIDEIVAPPTTHEILNEFEKQTKLTLPNSYREFLLKYNGGHPVPDYIDVPPVDDFPAQFRYFYGLDADKWYHDEWSKFNFFDTWIPFGILVFGELDLECAEVCFDFRRYPGNSFYARFRRFMFGSELLDSAVEQIPIKFFDWRYFNQTRKFREKDLFPVASNFDEFIGKLRTLTTTEEALIEKFIPEPNLDEAQKDQSALEIDSKNWQFETDRPPKLAALVKKYLAQKKLGKGK
jgi:hypothetical protein